MSAAQVYSISDYQSSTSISDSEFESRSGFSRVESATRKSHSLDTSQLYPFSEPSDATIVLAIGGLDECLALIEEARQVDPTTDYVAFDDALIRTQAKLRILFEYREKIGDGYGSVVNAILWSLKNKDTEILDKRQLTAVHNALLNLKRRPLLHFDSAMAIMDELEAVDLLVEPAILDEIFDFVWKDQSSSDGAGDIRLE